MTSLRCPGLTADWINAWLAAIGIAVVHPEARISWTDDSVPVAVVHSDAHDLVDLSAQLAARMDTYDLSDTAISDAPRGAGLDDFRAACRKARATGDFSAQLLTDLGGRDSTDPSAFYPPGPGPASTLHKRLTFSTKQDWFDLPVRLEEALAGSTIRHGWYGLGFDYRKIPTPHDPASRNLVVPGVELLAYFALVLFPHRGNGRRALTRGWTDRPSRSGAFEWGTWSRPLSAPAIDAFLDTPAVPSMPRFGVVPYQQLGTSDNTRGFASRRLR